MAHQKPMTAITPGAGSSWKSTTVESAIYEIGSFLEIGEDNPVNNPNAVDFITIDKSSSTGYITIKFTIPYQITTTVGGAINLTTPEYLTSVSYTRGTNSTIKSTNWASAFIEAIDFFKVQENDLIKNPIQSVRCTYSYGGRDNPRCVGQVILPFTDTINAAGNVVTTIGAWYS